MANEWDPQNVYEVLSDARARQILVATNAGERSAQELANICDGSVSSIYRRVDVLSECGLLEEDIRIDEDGHHFSVYEPTFDELRFALEDDSIAVLLGSGGEERPLEQCRPLEQ